MKTVVIPGTDLEVSRFAFGTASIMRVGMRKARRRLLAAAVDGGFTLFDTAPYYGFGVAERDLGAVLKRHPEVRVTTKVGIYVPGGEDQRPFEVLARKVGGKAFKFLDRPYFDFALKKAQHALEASLRKLGREHIELYLLHEAQIELLRTDEWLQWLESAKQAGKIGRFGLALTAAQLRPFLESHSPLADVVQVLDSLDGREADVLSEYHRPLQITFGYVSAARKAGNTSTFPELLRAAMVRNPQGPIIVSTTRASRAAQFERLAASA
jgi:aryl-alcohol dehydrogenase-like predicted oxidoreductase